MIKVTGTLDFECAGWDRPVVGCLYQPSIGARCYRNVSDLVDDLISRGGVWWAHNGARYDFLAIAEEIRRRMIPCSWPRVGRMEFAGVTLCDSYALIPLSLDKAIRMVGRESQSLSDIDPYWTCQCGSDCGGYCRITVTLSELRRVQLADYCIQDCKDLYDILSALFCHAADYGLDLKGTIGGSAWATAQRVLGLPVADMPPKIWDRVHRAYYGGRVIVARPRAIGPGTHWDLSSAYPAALSKTTMPYGKWAMVGGKRAYECLKRSTEGVYSVIVDIPQMHVPPLPIRTSDRIEYPYGDGVRGVWTLPEIEYALGLGVKITGVVWAIVYESRMVVFDELMESWYRMRRSSGPFSEWDSLFSKSLSGKLAESPDRESIRMYPPKIKWCPRTKPCSRTSCSGRCGAYRQVDLWGNIWATPYYRPAPSAHVAWGAYCTAATRITWHKEAIAQGEDLVYGDTDSIWTTSRIVPSPRGDGLGEWGLKETADGVYHWDEWQGIAPKVYRYRTGEKWTYTTAGASGICDEEWEAASTGATIVRARGVQSLGESAAAGKSLFRRQRTKWRPSARGLDEGHYGDRTLDVDSGLTVPRRYNAVS